MILKQKIITIKGNISLLQGARKPTHYFQNWSVTEENQAFILPFLFSSFWPWDVGA